MQELGYNYRLTDFQAALGIAQLQRAKAGLELSLIHLWHWYPQRPALLPIP